MELSATPWIGTESTEVYITVTFRDVSGTTPQGTPIIDRRTLNTRVRVQDGQPIVLGGLRRAEKADRFAGIPFLSAIKYVGLLFGGEDHSDNRTDFVIVLTPRVAVAGESDLMGLEDVYTRDVAIGKTPLEIPESPWGFDMWLLDDEKTLVL
jgi:type II secretory pathway component GspD/PulD (secretin)